VSAGATSLYYMQYAENDNRREQILHPEVSRQPTLATKRRKFHDSITSDVNNTVTITKSADNDNNNSVVVPQLL
jgi:hypothetical protein